MLYSIVAAILPSLTAAYTLGSKTGPAGWLEDQNYYRCMHDAQPVYWDDGLASKAQTWAEHLSSINSMVHSDAYNIAPYSGENLASGYKDMYTAMGGWYTEYDLWKCSGDWRKVSGKFGHFTAMVWKGIDRIGCGVSGKYYVCEYGSSKAACQGGGRSSACYGGTPSSLPNFNSSSSCGSDGSACVGCMNSSKQAQCAAMTTPVYASGSASATTTAAPVSSSNSTTTSTTPKATSSRTTTTSTTTTTTPKPTSSTTTTSTTRATTTTPAPSSSVVTTSTRVVTTSSGDVITDPAVNRLMGCTPAQLQAANQKCKALGKASFCQVLDAEPVCFGYDSVGCSCN